jgi:hypothetical protein
MGLGNVGSTWRTDHVCYFLRYAKVAATAGGTPAGQTPPVSGQGAAPLPAPVQTQARGGFFCISPNANHEVTDQELAAFRDLGVRSVRINYQSGHPVEAYESAIRRYLQNGIEPMMLVCYEGYAASSTEEQTSIGKRLRYTNAPELVRTIASIAPRFAALGVHSWEIWNEPNGMWYVPPEDYARLLCDVYERFKLTDRWDPSATIVFGGLDTTAVGTADGVNGLARDWLTSFYASPAYRAFRSRTGRSPYDVMATHPYYSDTPTKFDNNINGTCLQVMGAHGDGGLPIWITELGDQNASDEAQAAAIENLVRLAHRHPAVRRLYLFKYTTGDDYSIVRSNGLRRKAYYTYRQLSLTLTGK